MANRELKPAKDLAAQASKPYPNDSAAYREARTALMAEEIELRRHVERVAAMRRALPPGGEVPQDYAFVAEGGREVRLSELFGPHRTLVVYSWMYGKKRKAACPMCTALLGSLDHLVKDITQRVAFAVVATSSVERQLAHARERGWRQLPFYADDSEAFANDYRHIGPDGEDWAGFDVFHRGDDGKIRHFWSWEAGAGTEDPGEDPKMAPDPVGMWALFDMTPEGRDPKWYPKLSYGGEPAAK